MIRIITISYIETLLQKSVTQESIYNHTNTATHLLLSLIKCKSCDFARMCNTQSYCSHHIVTTAHGWIYILTHAYTHLIATCIHICTDNKTVHSCKQAYKYMQAYAHKTHMDIQPYMCPLLRTSTTYTCMHMPTPMCTHTCT